MNFRRQAIKYFSETESSESELYLATAGYLEHGESFLLPEGGYFFDADKDSDICLKGMQLPFDTCILEWRRRDPDSDDWVDVLVIVQKKGSDFALIPITCGGSSVSKVWIPALIGLLVADDAIVSTRDKFVTVHAELFVNPVLRSSIHKELADGANYLHEVKAVAQFLLLANCGNVSPVKIHEPSDKQIKAASKRRNAPFHSYWTLDCALPSSSVEARSLGGTHATPRLHMRRGHVRRLPTGKTTWVRQCAVGNANLGAVSKDYAVHI